MCALHWAALLGNLSCVEALIDAGAAIDEENRNKNTALQLAASKGHDEVVSLLCSKGSDIGHFNADGHDALILSCLSESRDHKSTSSQKTRSASQRPTIFQTLLDHGVNVNRVDPKGNTPLHECALHHLRQSVSLLVDAEANVNAVNKEGKTPLHLLCEACKINPEDSHSEGDLSAFAQAAVETAQKLLERGAHPNLTDSSGNTALDIIFKKLAVSNKFPEDKHFRV
jgi:ankyrin repeat protein